MYDTPDMVRARDLRKLWVGGNSFSIYCLHEILIAATVILTCVFMHLFYQSHYQYTTPAKKMLDKYSVVMDTPEYRTVQELKTHLSQART